jgi:2-keto-4-pentenoate hydratase/2-oxohepta-3-ene-1,7-dioic acid hydratase in catechol pathway
MAAIGRFQKGGEIFHAKVVDGELFRLRGDVFGSPSFDRRPTARKGVKTLVPVVPSKIIAVGLNYIEHARETGKPLPRLPLFWLKAATSLLPDGGKIEVPFPHHRTDYEAELAIVIGRKIRNVTPARRRRATFLVTRRRRTSATARFRMPRANGRAANRSTPSRRSVRWWKRKLIRMS